MIATSVGRGSPNEPPQFSSRTEAAIAAWNKLNPTAPASDDWRVAVQGVETASGGFLAYAETIDAEALTESNDLRPELISQLQEFKLHAIETLEAMNQYNKQMKIELKRTRFSEAAQQQIILNTMKGFQLMQAWAGAAIEAADAGITLRDLRARGLPTDSAQQNFTKTWSALGKAQEAVIQRASKTQQKTDEIIRR